ncbi:MAG: undecaprenyl-diphosphate phosphatase [Armatimonadetes bacterium]|nr:undecaprenyl-diphosphate phosphatase [Armatimonadota bacterium]MDW8121981.1 undecaprenyl-diphosphate phosphatase [Armatimonadota bacterium]
MDRPIGFELLIVLAIVQGLTEFLPVSSSGHLALIQNFFAVPEKDLLPITVFLHIGTLVALLIYFRRDLLLILRGLAGGDAAGRQLLILTLLANGATALVALPLKTTIEGAFSSPVAVALFLMGTGILLLLVSKRGSENPDSSSDPIRLYQALLVGVGQGLAAFPGLSRSGTTIATALLVGLSRQEAGRFSFLISIPAILGANLIEARDIHHLPVTGLSLAVGAIVSFVVGYLAIHWTLMAVRKAKLHWFSLYCFLIGGMTLLLRVTALWSDQ